MSEDTKKKKNLLHEVLAVVGSLEGAKDKILGEASNTFTKKAPHFLGWNRKLDMHDDARSKEETEENQALVTTVMAKLNYMKKACVRFYDAKFQKESGGQLAKADIIIDGNIIASDVPVYFLLDLEKEIKQLRAIYETIPTLAPGIEWKRAEDLGDGVWRAAHKVSKTKTEKTYQHKVLVPATKEHPAQIREWNEDRVIGMYVTDSWCGMLSPAEKSVILDRIDKLMRAIKKARQRANSQEVPKVSIGSALFSYIHGVK